MKINNFNLITRASKIVFCKRIYSNIRKNNTECIVQYISTNYKYKNLQN